MSQSTATVISTSRTYFRLELLNQRRNNFMINLHVSMGRAGIKRVYILSNAGMHYLLFPKTVFCRFMGFS